MVSVIRGTTATPACTPYVMSLSTVESPSHGRSGAVAQAK
jgi:hypothetical protein